MGYALNTIGCFPLHPKFVKFYFKGQLDFKPVCHRLFSFSSPVSCVWSCWSLESHLSEWHPVQQSENSSVTKGKVMANWGSIHGSFLCGGCKIIVTAAATDHISAICPKGSWCCPVSCSCPVCRAAQLMFENIMRYHIYLSSASHHWFLLSLPLLKNPLTPSPFSL